MGKPLRSSDTSALSSPHRVRDVDRVLDAAEELVISTRLGKGFTTNALAQTGILSVGAIHKHLGLRGEIIRKLLERQAGRLQVDLAAAGRSNKASLIKGHAEVLVRFISVNPALVEILEIERRRMADPSAPGLMPSLAESLASGFNEPFITVRKPVSLISQLLAEMMVSLAFRAQVGQRDLAKVAEGISKAALVLVDDPNWW